MDPARFTRIDEILQAALEIEPSARAAFVRRSCGDDEELRRDVDSLLRHTSRTILRSDRPAIAWVAPDLTSPVREGETLGRYRIERRIGAGGMGEVYEARDETLQRTVAIKVLPPELATDVERVQRFEQEALAASRLNHPNILTIFEIARLGGMQCLVTERVEGETLRSLLTDEAGAPQPLAVRQALDIATQVAKALQAAHDASIVHRDIKPENIMVRSDGVVKVLDFGIAKVTSEPDRPGCDAPSFSHANLTAPGTILGTASYMSPEQIRGEMLDESTDLFSLGVVLYEILSGERPFTGVSLAETSTVRLDQALPATNRIGALPKQLQRVIRRMLEPHREARFRSARELVDELQELRTRLDTRRTRTVATLSIGAVLVLLILGVIGMRLSFQETWQERVLRDGHTAAVQQLALSPDGRLLVSCSEDGQVIVWDFARRQRLQTLRLLAHKVAFSPDGRWFATGGKDGTVIVWDAARREPVRTLHDLRSDIGALAFSPDGSLLAGATYAHFALWRTRDWKKLYQWPNGGYGAFVFSRDLRHVLYQGHLYDIASGRQIQLEHPGEANWMALSPDARELAVLDAGGDLAVYRLAERGQFDHIEPVARRSGHQDNGRSLAYSPDGRLIATAAEDILLWNAATHEKLARFEYAAIVWSVVFSPDGRWLISSHADGAVLVWDVAERERVFNFNEHSGAVRSVAFSHDGRMLASGSEDRTITLWDPERGRKTAVLTGHATRVAAVAFSPSSEELASADADAVLVLWDVRKRQARLTLPTRLGGLCAAISPDGRLVATSRGVFSRDGRLLLEFAKTTLPNTRDYHAYPHVYGVAFSADGRRLAAVSEGGLVMVWDARTLRLLALHDEPGTSQISVSLSARGEMMITGEDEGAVRLWSVTPLRQEAILGRHTARVKSVAFAPDGKTAASAGDDKTIALWDIERRTLRSRIGTHTSPVYSIAFSPDGRQLASGEHDRSVRIYTRLRTVWGMEWDMVE